MTDTNITVCAFIGSLQIVNIHSIDPISHVNTGFKLLMHFGNYLLVIFVSSHPILAMKIRVTNAATFKFFSVSFCRC